MRQTLTYLTYLRRLYIWVIVRLIRERNLLVVGFKLLIYFHIVGLLDCWHLNAAFPTTTQIMLDSHMKLDNIKVN